MAENKNLDPSDHKIKQARDKGQIAYSQDLARLSTLVLAGEAAFLTESLWRETIHEMMNFSYESIGKAFLPALYESLTSSALFLLLLFLASFVVVIVAALVGHWSQFGVLFAPEAAVPQFDKLNPVNGLKSIFSAKKLVEVLQTVVKSAAIAFIVYLLSRDALPTIIHLAAGTPKDVYTAFIDILRDIFHVALIVSLVFAVIDFAVQKYFHKSELMMDMEELKEEMKEMEGDPMIKNQRKQIAREWANEDPVASTGNANAVVVNPTHFAVALYYDQKGASVPVVVAKGRDRIAQAMIDHARELGIPVIRHVWLARTLYATCKANSVIPKSGYEAAARVYAVIHYLMAAGQKNIEFELESRGDPPEGLVPGREE